MLRFISSMCRRFDFFVVKLMFRHRRPLPRRHLIADVLMSFRRGTRHPHVLNLRAVDCISEGARVATVFPDE